MKIIEGNKFHNLEAIKYIGNRRNSSNKSVEIWLFKCNCGNHTELPSSEVSRGRIKYCSKECKLKGDINLISAFKRVYRTYKNRAGYRNLSFTLTIPEFKNITDSNCFYCNLQPENLSKERGTEYLYSGVDRLDNKLGYTLENSVACCKTCNVAKNNLSTEEFKLWIKRIISFNNKFIFDDRQ